MRSIRGADYRRGEPLCLSQHLHQIYFTILRVLWTRPAGWPSMPTMALTT
jgi:hypothetical protein